MTITAEAQDTVLDLPDMSQFESWLELNPDKTEVWVRVAKKHSGLASVTAAEAIEIALCFGWIDGHRKGLDDVSFLQRFSPRRRGSSWSKVNVDTVGVLTASGRMREPGLAQVAAAKADGRWDAAYESQRTAEVPEDLVAALASEPRAGEAFDRLNRSGRYALILPLLKARSAAGRAKILAREIAELASSANT